MRGYLKCNSGRNDYKNESNGVRGICLLAGEVSCEKQKPEENTIRKEGEAA